MLKFLIDEDMQRSTATTLKARGYVVLDIRDCGLRGKSDEEVFNFAQPIPISSCTIINSPGTYILSKNIGDLWTYKCMEITSSDVILDGKD